MKEFVLSREAHLPVIRAAWELGEIAIQNVEAGRAGACANRSHIGPCIVAASFDDQEAREFPAIYPPNSPIPRRLVDPEEHGFFYALQRLHDFGMTKPIFREQAKAALQRVLFNGAEPEAECADLQIILS